MDQHEFELRLMAVLQPIERINVDLRQVPNRASPGTPPDELDRRIKALESILGERRAELRTLLRENADLWI